MEAIRVEITDQKHQTALSEWYGLLRAVDALNKVEFGKLPGFALAVALVGQAEAEAKSQCVASNLRAVTKAGIDTAATKSVALIYLKGRPVLEVEMLDLADMAEDGHEQG